MSAFELDNGPNDKDLWRSALRHNRTYAVQQKEALFDDLVGAGE